MANVRIKDLPLNVPTRQSWLPFEVITSGAYTTSRATLSSIIAIGSNALWQSASTTVSALSSNWQNNTTSYTNDKPVLSSGYLTTKAFSGFWLDAYNFVNAGKNTWDTGAVRAARAYTTVQDLSTSWTSARSTVSALSARWETSYTTFYGISANLPRKFATTFGNGINNPNTITHNLNTRDVIISVALNAPPYTVTLPSVITCDTVNTVSITMPSTPTTNQYRATIISA
jgi:hypothetical protein